jgi:ferritin-like metal-binding protein YciE
MSSTVSGEIISWQEAMAQCGDDEEFLRELLADLRSETQTQINVIAQIIAVSHRDSSGVVDRRRSLA